MQDRYVDRLGGLFLGLERLTNAECAAECPGTKDLNPCHSRKSNSTMYIMKNNET